MIHSMIQTVPCVTAESPVNVDQAKQIGEAILQNIDGADISKHSFRKKDVTFAAMTHIKMCGELPLLFMYELCSYPPSLFESSGMH